MLREWFEDIQESRFEHFQLVISLTYSGVYAALGCHGSYSPLRGFPRKNLCVLIILFRVVINIVLYIVV